MQLLQGCCNPLGSLTGPIQQWASIQHSENLLLLLSHGGLAKTTPEPLHQLQAVQLAELTDSPLQVSERPPEC